MTTHVNPHTRGEPDDERARRWLQRQLEWEEILGTLRDAGRGERSEPARGRQEPAAA